MRGAAAPHTIPAPLAPSPVDEAWGQRTHRLAGAEESPWGPQTTVLAQGLSFSIPQQRDERSWLFAIPKPHGP